MKKPRFRVTEENRQPMDTALDARIAVPVDLQEKYRLPPAERANVIITAYYNIMPEDSLEATGIVRLGDYLYRCENYYTEENWILGECLEEKTP